MELYDDQVTRALEALLSSRDREEGLANLRDILPIEGTPLEKIRAIWLAFVCMSKGDERMNTNGIKQAFESFMSNEQEVREAIDSSTTAGYSGSGYSIELFDDGHYRVLWNNQIGNLYNTPGIIVGIPKLADDEVGDSDTGMESFYENAIETLRQSFDYAIEEA